ncbi:unnamed protein product [Trichobilharzia szidati]|nr:unnamed protein product [Trichobilharzia szidati]
MLSSGNNCEVRYFAVACTNLGELLVLEILPNTSVLYKSYFRWFIRDITVEDVENNIHYHFHFNNWLVPNERLISQRCNHPCKLSCLADSLNEGSSPTVKSQSQFLRQNGSTTQNEKNCNGGKLINKKASGSLACTPDTLCIPSNRQFNYSFFNPKTVCQTIHTIVMFVIYNGHNDDMWFHKTDPLDLKHNVEIGIINAKVSNIFQFSYWPVQVKSVKQYMSANELIYNCSKHLIATVSEEVEHSSCKITSSHLDLHKSGRNECTCDVLLHVISELNFQDVIANTAGEFLSSYKVETIKTEIPEMIQNPVLKLPPILKSCLASNFQLEEIEGNPTHFHNASDLTGICANKVEDVDVRYDESFYSEVDDELNSENENNTTESTDALGNVINVQVSFLESEDELPTYICSPEIIQPLKMQSPPKTNSDYLQKARLFFDPNYSKIPEKNHSASDSLKTSKNVKPFAANTCNTTRFILKDSSGMHSTISSNIFNCNSSVQPLTFPPNHFEISQDPKQLSGYNILNSLLSEKDTDNFS